MPISRSQNILEKRAQLPPPVTPNMAKSVSQFRRDQLESQIEMGEFREGGLHAYNIIKQNSQIERTALSNLSYSNKALRKEASTSTPTNTTTGSGFNYRGTGGTVRQIPEIYSPLWLHSNLNLPRDRATINAWSRAFFALYGFIQNPITLHSTYPIAKLNIKCKDKRKQDFFEEMIEEIDLINTCIQIAQEYWTLGEAFPYAELDERTRKWKRILIQNPDYITVRWSPVAGEPIISVRPDENLRRIITSNKPEDIAQRQKIDKMIIDHVKRNENIPLHNLFVSHIARRIAPYEIRGTGLIVSVFKQLMLFDQLRESKFAQAANMINPLMLVKIGAGEGGYRPTPADLEAWRQVFEEAQYDKDFKIFTHDAVTVEAVGRNSGMVDISGDVTQLLKEIYIGLLVPSAIMDGGSDTTYANASVSLDVLRQRYMFFRNMMTMWLRRKIFAPIAKLNDFYEIVEGKRVLTIPDVDWNYMNLFDMGDHVQILTQLADPQSKRVSYQTLYRSLGLDWEEEKLKMRTEAVWEAIAEKEKENLKKMTLNDLRALTKSNDKEIQEIHDSPVPGESITDETGEEQENLPGMSSLPPPPSSPPPGPPPAPPSK